jgi:2-oxoisovalerate dehydrogenase E1 component alpha subunit
MPLDTQLSRQDGFPAPDAVYSGDQWLPAQRSLQLHRLMVRCRVMEERMIKMSKSGEAFFWVGGPGEEAFNTALGLQVKRGCGPDFDYLHLHYRNSAVMLAMGMQPIDAIRQMAMTATDPYSMGRNFVGHFAKRDWNVLPVSSAIENQFTVAPGTALVQKRHGGDGVSIVIGGDAGTAEGDFATCMIWSTRPGSELPVLMIVTNNRWGISTPAHTQHGEKQIADRAHAFGIKTEVVSGNDPIASWHAIARGLEHCRTQRRPYLIEANVSRLYGHSSSSGAIRIEGEPDCIPIFEQKLLKAGLVDRDALRAIHKSAAEEVETALQQALREPRPTPADVLRHTYAPSRVDAVYPRDYDGLPEAKSQIPNPKSQI